MNICSARFEARHEVARYDVVDPYARLLCVPFALTCRYRICALPQSRSSLRRLAAAAKEAWMELVAWGSSGLADFLTLLHVFPRTNASRPQISVIEEIPAE
jgi:hypothetical protein